MTGGPPPLYAVVRVNTFDLDRLATGAEQLEQFDSLHAAQPGYVGGLVVDLQGGRRLVVNLWQSEEHSNRGLTALGPHVGRLLAPLLLRPSEFLGAGTVLSGDLQGLHHHPHDPTSE
jgi:hypothetical protein